MRLLRTFLHHEHGIAVTEFALIAPFLLLLLLGSIEIARYLQINQKADKIAYTAADVVAQSKSVSTALMDQLLSASQDMMNPYSFGSDGIIYITSVTKSAGNYPTVNWRYSGGGSLSGQSSQLGSVGSSATLPGGLTLADRDNVIIAEVYYRFRPLFGVNIVSTRVLYKTAIYKPRLGALTRAPS